MEINLRTQLNRCRCRCRGRGGETVPKSRERERGRERERERERETHIETMLPSYAGGAHRVVVQRSESQDVSVGRRVALPAALLTLAAVACVLAGGGSHKGMVSLNQLGVRSPLPTIPQATYPFQRGGAQPTPASARSLETVGGSSPRENSSRGFRAKDHQFLSPPPDPQIARTRLPRSRAPQRRFALRPQSGKTTRATRSSTLATPTYDPPNPTATHTPSARRWQAADPPQRSTHDALVRNTSWLGC